MFDRDGFFVCVILPGTAYVCAILAVVMLIGSLGAHAENRFRKRETLKVCNVFSEQSGRETKFVEYSYWRVDCLTPQENGQWISVYNLRGN